jgi:hypothetical protein
MKTAQKISRLKNILYVIQVVSISGLLKINELIYFNKFEIIG